MAARGRPPRGDVATGTTSVDVVVVGAGFSGMYALYRLRGSGLSVRVFETGDNVGGTWYWNRYPGARVDVPSLSYSYSFSSDLQQEWSWPETYSAQPDLLRYAESVADRFDLRRDIAFETTVVRAAWDARTARWNIATDRGDAVSARFLVSAAGCLSATNMPDFPGIDSFDGKLVPHVALAQGGGRPRRQACRCGRHGLFWDPGHSGHRRAGVPSVRLPADAQLQLPVEPQADGSRCGAGVEGALRRAPGQGPRLLRRAACRGARPLGARGVRRRAHAEIRGSVETGSLRSAPVVQRSAHKPRGERDAGRIRARPDQAAS